MSGFLRNLGDFTRDVGAAAGARIGQKAPAVADKARRVAAVADVLGEALGPRKPPPPLSKGGGSKPSIPWGPVLAAAAVVAVVAAAGSAK